MVRVLPLAAVSALAAERLIELALSARNERVAKARGAVEVGRGQHAAIAGFHTAFLISCALEGGLRTRDWPLGLSVAGFAGVAGTQALRYWAIRTLGSRWNTKVLVWPDAPPVLGGPYRFLRHPNYAAVAAELPLFGLAVGAPIAAALFGVAGLAVLAFRIRLEERALGAAWQAAFARLPRCLPTLLRRE